MKQQHEESLAKQEALEKRVSGATFGILEETRWNQCWNCWNYEDVEESAILDP